MVLLLVFLWMITAFLPAWIILRQGTANEVPNIAIWVLICLVFPVFGLVLYMAYWRALRTF
jgi:hypothetical protein